MWSWHLVAWAMVGKPVELLGANEMMKCFLVECSNSMLLHPLESVSTLLQLFMPLLL